MAAAEVFDPHAYKGKGEGRPCSVCGSGPDAYVHSDEAAENGYSLVIRDVSVADAGKGRDSSR